LLQTLVEQNPAGTIYVAWDKAGTHEDEEVEMDGRAGSSWAAGVGVPTYPPTSSPGLNPIEMLWRQFRRDER
jgi:hypothetical protein